LQRIIKKYNFNSILHIGDVCYASVQVPYPPSLQRKEEELQIIWDIFGRQIEKVAAYTPWMIGAGNHERFFNWTAYNSRYHMPGDQQKDRGGNNNYWYSFDYGLVHFTMMSTEHEYLPNTPQYKWLENDLKQANANRAKTPFLILTGHRPMYCSDDGEYNQHKPGAIFQTIIEPLMVKYAVDLYLCGHMHCYERIYPVINGTVISHGSGGKTFTNPGAPIHVVQGTGGIFTDKKWVQPTPAWSASTGSEWGYGRMLVTSKSIHYAFIGTVSDRVIDEFWLTKN